MSDKSRVPNGTNEEKVIRVDYLPEDADEEIIEAFKKAGITVVCGSFNIDEKRPRSKRLSFLQLTSKNFGLEFVYPPKPTNEFDREITVKIDNEKTKKAKKKILSEDKKNKKEKAIPNPKKDGKTNTSGKGNNSTVKGIDR